MNIDVLDEDGASNIAHSEIFAKEKTPYLVKAPEAQTNTKPIHQSDNCFDSSKQTTES